MLAATLRRYRGNRAFNQLEKRLLYALARHITRDRRIVRFARDLVDLVDVNDACLRLFDIVIALLQEFLNDVFNIFADVTGFSQRRCVRDRKRHVEQPRECLCKQRLATPGRTDQQDIAFRKLDIILGALVEAIIEALIVIVNSDCEDFLGLHLADDILVKNRIDFLRLGQLVATRVTTVLELLANDVITELDAFITDEDGWTSNQLAYFVLAFAAKRTIEEFAVLVLTAGIITHSGTMPL